MASFGRVVFSSIRRNPSVRYRFVNSLAQSSCSARGRKTLSCLSFDVKKNSSLINRDVARFSSDDIAAQALQRGDVGEADLQMVKDSIGTKKTSRDKIDFRKWSDVWDMYEGKVGNTMYDPFCTQLEHAFQTAQMAKKRGAIEAMQLAAFFHDIGHLVLDEHDGMPDLNGQGEFLHKDLKHETVGFQCLKELGFGEEVLVPVCLHVRAKRYLCSVDEHYWAALSDNSKKSLDLQGGRLNAQELEHFQKNKYALDAAQLRRWEDEGKNYYNKEIKGGRLADCRNLGEEYLTITHVKQWVDRYFL